MVENPVSDMMIRLRNAALAGQKTVEIPHSGVREALARILMREGYLVKVGVEKVGSPRRKDVTFKTIKADLRYQGRKSVLKEVKIISKSSRRFYVKKNNIPRVLGGRGLVVLSTPQGLMSGREAKKKGLGGEVICEVW
ncbi:MAG: 30S ribosomal protein S8 [bacterium]|nr:30S ribosomal protein S8 [bacterium]